MRNTILITLLGAGLAFAAVSTLAATTPAQTAPRQLMLDKTRAKFSAACEKAKGDRDSIDRQYINCECMPTQIYLLESDYPDGKDVPVDPFIDRVNYYVDICTAKLMKKTVASSCLKGGGDDKPNADRQAYCACVEKQVRSLSDQEIAKDLETQGNSDKQGRVQQALSACRP